MELSKLLSTQMQRNITDLQGEIKSAKGIEAASSQLFIVSWRMMQPGQAVLPGYQPSNRNPEWPIQNESVRLNQGRQF